MSPTVRTRSAALGAGAIALTAALVISAPLAASAHVHVDPVEAEPGTDHVDLTFSVRNESPTASTTEVSIVLPDEAAFTTVEPADVRGWRWTLAGDDGTPSRVRFVAEGAGVGDGQTQDLVVRFGPVPDLGSLPIPVVQTYSDGTVERWDEPVPVSGAEPEHPAPTLFIRDAPPAEDHGTAEDDGTDGAVPAAAAGPPDASGAAALVLAGTALAVGVLAAVLAALALVRTARRGRA